jgi:hypothetical protein
VLGVFLCICTKKRANRGTFELLFNELLPFLVGSYFGSGVSEETLLLWLRA